MRVLILVLTAAAPVMLAQARGGGRGVRGGPGPRVAPAPPNPGVVARPGFAPVYIVGGGYYPVPVYGAGYADPYAYAPVAPQPDPSAVYPNGQAPNAPPPAYYGADPSGQGYPTILVNPNYTPQTANPVMRDYSYLPAAGDASAQNNAGQNDTASQSSVVFLIAMQDHAIYPAVAYWVENSTLNYITQQGKRMQVPMSQVDRDFSTQLNKERNIEFALPNVN